MTVLIHIHTHKKYFNSFFLFQLTFRINVWRARKMGRKNTKRKSVYDEAALIILLIKSKYICNRFIFDEHKYSTNNSLFRPSQLFVPKRISARKCSRLPLWQRCWRVRTQSEQKNASSHQFYVVFISDFKWFRYRMTTWH